MSNDEKTELNDIKDKLRDCWLQAQNEIRQIEIDNPEFKKMFKKNDAYMNYIYKKGIFSGISFAHGELENFFNNHKWDGEIMDRPTFYKIGNTRIKLSNIKDYSLGTVQGAFLGYFKNGHKLTNEDQIKFNREFEESGMYGVIYGCFSEYIESEKGYVAKHDKDKKCLYISTYQNDDFRFDEDEVDIYKAFNDLDKYLT